ncbi:hypothetical protein GCM10020001_100380 [Nonomuraea salmonea]
MAAFRAGRPSARPFPNLQEGSRRMTAQLVALSWDAHDPAALARFWAGVLRWESADDPRGGVALLPPDDTGFRIRFQPTEAEKIGQNQIHFDLTSASPDAQQATVDRALALGGRHIDIGQGPDEGHVVLADPEGNEFCVIEYGNKFLAECGFIGALSCDGSQKVGYFWSAALEWPLVWDQDEETAIRSPHGGPKITWGGPPLAPPRRARTASTSTSPHPPAETRRRRSSACSPWARPASTSARATRSGPSSPTRTATNSASCPGEFGGGVPCLGPVSQPGVLCGAPVAGRLLFLACRFGEPGPFSGRSCRRRSRVRRR